MVRGRHTRSGGSDYAMTERPHGNGPARETKTLVLKRNTAIVRIVGPAIGERCKARTHHPSGRVLNEIHQSESWSRWEHHIGNVHLIHSIALRIDARVVARV